ncbi:hypothetical protein N0V83_010392 [Neocucurbitaria cava]|uniref:Uncharacterized protein n=1 Tax=Neocucurbitaria cava TaxID=798079 RepID=A0A9W8XXI1_9PLEO|nr:hypothetical protein N0V83_010392 [Neocucurbitaria cava]
MANPPSSPEFDWKMYRYVPSLAGAMIALIIFLIMAILHLHQFFRLKNRIIIFVVVGALCEVGGFGARIGSHFDNQAWGQFIVQGVLLLVGPLFFAATIYMMLGRTIRLAGGEDVSLIPARWYTRIFVTADVATLIIQGLGASIMGTMQLALALAGEKIVIAGLALQVATFVVFLVAAVDFQTRMSRKAAHTPYTTTAAPSSADDWKKMLYILYSVSALILVRCTFRLIEYSMGNAGYLISHEWTLYVFDACDEAQPTCNYCSTRKLDCEYPPDSSSASRSPSSSVAPSDDSSSTPLLNEEVDFSDTSQQISTWVIPPAFASSGQLTFLDHELLHHYKTSTWKTFAVREDAIVHSLHRDYVPQSSISHSYLLYALLSIAASDRNLLRPSKQVEKQALVYRQKTFEEYTKALQNITAENYETVLVTGMFLLALLPSPKPEDTDSEHLEWMYSLLKMSEGLRVLASLRWGLGIEKLSVYPLICRELRTLPPPPLLDTVESSKLCTPVGPLGTTPDHPNPAPTYEQHPPSSNPVFLPPRLMALFESLVNPPTTGPIDMHRNSLVPVFHALSPIFLSLYYYHINQDFYVRIFVFTSFLMPDFLALVKAREPRALTLIAWWFALAGMVKGGWWVGSRVRRVIESIESVVRKSGDVQTVQACDAAVNVVEVFERMGSEEAARSIFQTWEGVTWDEGPRKAEEWEFGQLLDLV